jgi:hypothetical protein
MIRRLLPTGGPLALHAGVLAWLTWPLATRLGTHLPDSHGACRFDAIAVAYVLARETHALFTAPLGFFEGNFYHPAAHSLLYGPSAFGALPLFAPVFALTGNPALALNITFLGGVLLTAWMLHLVVHWWTGSHLGGAIAGFTFLTTRWVLWEFVPTAPFYAMLPYLPLIVFTAARRTPTLRGVLPLAALVFLQCLTDPIYIAPAVLGPLGAIALGRLVGPSTRAAGRALIGGLALAIIAVIAVHAGQVLIRLGAPLTQQTAWGTAGQASVDVPWGLLGWQAPTAVAPASLALIALGAVLFALRPRDGTGRELRSAWLHASLWAGLGVFMSLSPILHVLGHTIELPWARWIPVYRLLRAPGRLGVAGLVGMSILAGLAFAECARRLAARRTAGTRLATVALAAFVVWAIHAEYVEGFGTPRFERKPLPPRYPIVEALASDTPVIAALRQPGGPLLELPLGAFDVLPPFHARAMYRSIFHWRPLLNGYDSYWPVGFPERMQLAAKLPDPVALAALRLETGLAMILVQGADLDPDARRMWEEIAAGGRDDLALVVRDGTDLLFRVTPAAGPS